jgi:hypothetical protein
MFCNYCQQKVVSLQKMAQCNEESKFDIETQLQYSVQRVWNLKSSLYVLFVKFTIKCKMYLIFSIVHSVPTNFPLCPMTRLILPVFYVLI